MATIELTSANLQSTIDDNPIVLVDFWADWCGPCKAFGPVFEKASEQHPDIAFAKCDTKAQPEVAAAFDVQSIPTLAVFRDQVLIFIQPGALPPGALDELIVKVRALDMAEVRKSMGAQAPPAPAKKPSAAAGRPAGPVGEQARPALVASLETGAGLTGLADDFVLRRQGVTSQFLERAVASAGLARRLLELYGQVRAQTREHGAEGRASARVARAAFEFDPARDLDALDPDTRSEVKAVLRAIDELIKD